MFMGTLPVSSSWKNPRQIKFYGHRKNYHYRFWRSRGNIEHPLRSSGHRLRLWQNIKRPPNSPRHYYRLQQSRNLNWFKGVYLRSWHTPEHPHGTFFGKGNIIIVHTETIVAICDSSKLLDVFCSK